MIKHEYYDLRNGELKPCYQWQMAFNKHISRMAHYEARKHAATFLEHPSIDPYEAYSDKFKELSNNQVKNIKPIYSIEVA